MSSQSPFPERVKRRRILENDSTASTKPDQLQPILQRLTELETRDRERELQMKELCIREKKREIEMMELEIRDKKRENNIKVLETMIQDQRYKNNEHSVTNGWNNLERSTSVTLGRTFPRCQAIEWSVNNPSPSRGRAKLALSPVNSNVPEINEVSEEEMPSIPQSTNSSIMPLLIRQLTEVADSIYPEQSFNLRFLRKFLNWDLADLDCFCHAKEDSAEIPVGLIVSATASQPCLPTKPGQHGAKLIGVLCRKHDPDLQQKFPLFIGKGRDKYIYFGEYREPSFPNILSLEEMARLPEEVKQGISYELYTQCRNSMSGCCFQFLKDTLWPYTIDVNTGAAPTQELSAIGKDVKTWDITTDKNMSKLKSRDFEAFLQEPDSSPNPTLHLGWQYLECIGYDQDFYNRLLEGRVTNNRM
ncbi:MAG: hypothetical protein M1834_003903 [Cirrosporium novae-zelandiae]|nr:MAG: hypothetical protein M1834_003903 [Cirrosporium novae-zelandiae]